MVPWGSPPVHIQPDANREISLSQVTEREVNRQDRSASLLQRDFLDPTIGEGNLESESTNSLLGNLIDAIPRGLRGGTFHEPVQTKNFERAAHVRQVYAR